MDKEEIIAELRRVAKISEMSRLSRRQFSRHSHISTTTVENKFGTWNQALQAAGLDTALPGPTPEFTLQKYSDDELLQEIIRLTQEIGKKPSSREMNAKGRFSEKTYRRRWEAFDKACQVAYAKYGFPVTRIAQATNPEELTRTKPALTQKQTAIPQATKPLTSNRRRKVQFGEPIDFRGLRFAPINEQGVVYVFGMISRELGFLIESIRTDYPDCEGKRCVDLKRQRWEHVLIEFEYQSSNFREHGHNHEDCDLIVCWIHDWKDCPVEVLELKSQIKSLPNK